jgi:gliding motility-associated lipoprotein GldH
LKRTSSQYILNFTLIISSFLLICSCTTVDIFEKNVAIPNHAWSSQFKPEISFEIQDTTSRYHIYVVIRHTDAYRYKNIWLNVEIQSPGGTTRSQSLDLQLATDDKGWLGSGMDDIFEHRILITPPQRPEVLKKGTYRFRLSNIMREDPLDHVMNMGIRVEKAK